MSTEKTLITYQNACSCVVKPKPPMNQTNKTRSFEMIIDQHSHFLKLQNFNTVWQLEMAESPFYISSKSFRPHLSRCSMLLCVLFCASVDCWHFLFQLVVTFHLIICGSTLYSRVDYPFSPYWKVSQLGNQNGAFINKWT